MQKALSKICRTAFRDEIKLQVRGIVSRYGRSFCENIIEEENGR